MVYSNIHHYVKNWCYIQVNSTLYSKIFFFFTTQYIHIIVFNMLISRPYSLYYYDSCIKTARTEMDAAPSFCFFSPIEGLLPGFW